MSTPNRVKVNSTQTVAPSNQSLPKEPEMVDVLVESLSNLSDEQLENIIQKLSHRGSHIGAQIVTLFEAMLLQKLQEKMLCGELDRELSKALGLPQSSVVSHQSSDKQLPLTSYQLPVENKEKVTGHCSVVSEEITDDCQELAQAKSLPQLTWFVEQFIGRALSEVIRRDREHIRNEELKAELQKRKREQLNESLSQAARELRSVVNSWAFILYFFVLVLTLGAFIGLLVGINLPNITTNLSNQSWLQLLKFKKN